MLVLIDQDFFQRPEALSLGFLELFSLARDGRHAVLTKPPFNPSDQGPVSDWLFQLTESIRQEARRILVDGIRMAANSSSGTARVIITEQGSEDWGRARLNLEDAVRLLRTPLGLLLENRRSDLCFLMMLAPPTQRSQLKRAIDAGWIDVIHGGGLGEMHALIQDAAASQGSVRSLIRLLRLWVLFDRDSDAADRSRPSSASDGLKEMCEEVLATASLAWRLEFVQLGRRSIENYLPEALLRVWQAEKTGSDMTKRRKAIDALCSLRKTRPDTAGQLNMKRGLLGDLCGEVRSEIRETRRNIRDEDLDPIFQGLSDEERRSLAEGFGEKISGLFARGHEVPHVEAAFQSEFDRGRRGTDPTRHSIIESLLVRL